MQLRIVGRGTEWHPPGGVPSIFHLKIDFALRHLLLSPHTPGPITYLSIELSFITKYQPNFLGTIMGLQESSHYVKPYFG